MCGRYASSRQTDDLVAELDVRSDLTGEPIRSVLANPQQPPAGAPDFNAAPTKAERVLVHRGDERQLRLMTWGLVPSWARDPAGGARMANARSETMLEKPAFRKAAATRRCLVPADGWYEWQQSPTVVDAKGKPRKQPFFMSRVDGDVLALAGLYEFWRAPGADPDDPLSWLTTFTIVTGAAEPGLDRVHDRMPMVLDRDRWDAWLDPGTTDGDTVRSLLAAYAPGRFQARPVSRAVNSPANNGPELLAPAPASELDGAVDPMSGELLG